MDSDEECLEENANVMDAYYLRPVFDSILQELIILPDFSQEYEKSHKSSQHYFFRNATVPTPTTFQTRLPLKTLHKPCNKVCAIYCTPKLPSSGEHCLCQLFRAVRENGLWQPAKEEATRPAARA